MKVSMLVYPSGEAHPSGLGRAVAALAHALARTSSSHDSFVAYAPSSVPLSSLAYLGIPVRHLCGTHVATAFPPLEKDADVHLFFTPVVPLLWFPRRAVVIAHDFAYLEFSERSLAARLRRAALWCLHWLSLRKASAVVAISAQTKQVLIERFGVPQERIRIIYDGYMPLGEPEAIEGMPRDFFLYPGTLKPRKNIPNIMRAFASFVASHPDSSQRLVITGTTGGSYHRVLVELVSRLGIAERVRFTGYVSDGQLATLNRRATALVFPSLLEGFGMPILEAMHAGLPVITSSVGAVAEVAGDAALLVDPHDVDAIAEAMGRIAVEAQLREDLCRKGHARAEEFSWEKAAAQLRELLHHETTNP